MGPSAKHHSLSMNRASQNVPSEIDSRSRVMMEKERKKKEDEEK
jgi:hypothetical protein